MTFPPPLPVNGYINLPVTLDPNVLIQTAFADIQAQYLAGKLAPQDVVKIYLDRINTFDRSSKGQPPQRSACSQATR